MIFNPDSPTQAQEVIFSRKTTKKSYPKLFFNNIQVIKAVSGRSFRFKIIFLTFISKQFKLFHDGGRCRIETSPLICRANQWTGFYIITASVMKELTAVNITMGLLRKFQQVLPRPF